MPRVASDQNPADAPSAEPAEPSVLAGIHPADSISSCRPTKAQRSISLTRFLDDLKVQTKPANRKSLDGSENKFQIPKTVPGAEVPPLTVPARDLNEPYETHREKTRAAYKSLPALPAFPFTPEDNPDERIGLAELQEIAYTKSPLLQAAVARVEQAKGQTVQARLYPNPVIGYEADTVNTNASYGYHGIYASQTVITADKLKRAQAVSAQDIAAAQYELRQIQINLATSVRRNYFLALIAQERLKFARGLADLFQYAFEAQIDLVAGGESAAYEPLQLRVFAVEARNAVIRAGNDYVSAWRQLAAVLNSPALKPRELDGSPEMPVPDITYENALAMMLARHTDLSIAQTKINKSEFNLGLQKVTPIPNVDLYGTVQYDDTTTLDSVTYNFQLGLPIPVFNKNQGNISSAEAKIVENHQNLVAAQIDLTTQLAEIYARYASNRVLAQNYREEILPDQVRTYRGVYRRFREGADNVDFAQIIVTQQQLGQIIGDYVNVLSAQWQAVVDLAEVLQADDLLSLDQNQPLPAGEPQPPKPLLVPLPVQKPE